MTNEIKAWLISSRNFEQGLALYKKYGTNNTLINLFSAKGSTSFTSAKLLQELTNLSKSGIGDQESQPEKKELQLTHHPIQKAPVASFPEPIQSMYKEALRLLDINKDRKTKIGLLVEDALGKFNPNKEIHKINQFLKERGSEQLVHEHLEGCFQEGKLWERINHWRKTGSLPEPDLVLPEEIILMDMHNLISHRNVLRSRISQCKRKQAPRKFNKEARVAFYAKNKKMILDYEAEKKLYDIRINELV